MNSDFLNIYIFLQKLKLTAGFLQIFFLKILIYCFFLQKIELTVDFFTNVINQEGKNFFPWSKYK